MIFIITSANQPLLTMVPPLPDVWWKFSNSFKM